MGECEITWRHYAVTGSIKLWSLFLTLPTRWLTGQQNHFSGGVRDKQGFELPHHRRFFTEPCRPHFRLQDHGHPIVKLGA
jgi:hypothetical protein